MPRPRKKTIGPIVLEAQLPRGTTLLVLMPVQVAGAERKLLEAPANDTDAPRLVWNQVAKGGTYKGHSSGDFTFDKGAFDEMVANFRAHPKYTAGPGKSRVIPADFHHASEGPAKNVAVAGAPAQGWIYELETRTDASGAATLWAQFEWLEPAAGYIRDGKYDGLSVAVWPDAVDPVSGARIGWYMSSVALTNDPFIQGMAKVAAERAGLDADRGAKVVRLYGGPEDVVCDLRWIFGLTALDGIDAVMAAVEQLKGFVADPSTVPAGVDIDRLMERVRGALQLPVLAPVEQVFAHLALLPTVLEPTEQPGEPATYEHPERGTAMSDLATKLAERLGVNAQVIAASRDKTPKSVAALEYETERTLEHTLLAAEADRTTVAKLCELTGIKSVPLALEALTKAFEDAKALVELRPQIVELKAAREKAEADAIESDVDAVIKVHKLSAVVRPSLLRDRKADALAFAKDYPMPAKGFEHVTTQLATSRTGTLRVVGGSVQLGNGGQRPAHGNAPLPKTRVGTTPERDDQGGELEPGTSTFAETLSRYPGANVLAQAQAYLADKAPKASFQETFDRAVELVREKRASGELPAADHASYARAAQQATQG
jgi:hypothetical protein